MIVERNTNKPLSQSVKTSPKQAIWGKKHLSSVLQVHSMIAFCSRDPSVPNVHNYETTELHRIPKTLVVLV